MENLAFAKAITKTNLNDQFSTPIVGVIPDTITNVTITGKIDLP